MCLLTVIFPVGFLMFGFTLFQQSEQSPFAKGYFFHFLSNISSPGIYLEFHCMHVCVFFVYFKISEIILFLSFCHFSFMFIHPRSFSCFTVFYLIISWRHITCFGQFLPFSFPPISFHPFHYFSLPRTNSFKTDFVNTGKESWKR